MKKHLPVPLKFITITGLLLALFFVSSITIAAIDVDSDGVLNTVDNCPEDVNPGQADADADDIGDACDGVNDVDVDEDGIVNTSDNCSQNSNAGQEDTDGDGLGAACDPDDGVSDTDVDSDSILNASDNCSFISNVAQTDSDLDGLGNACDVTDSTDADADGVLNGVDNCANDSNAGQEDTDGDGLGDACYTPPPVFSGAGTGVEGDEYIITTCEQLIEVNEDLSAYYELDQSLDCTLNTNDIMIGTSLFPFTGSFNGNDHVITIDVDTDISPYAGLFRSIDGGIVTNLGVAGTTSGSGYIGGLVGYANNADIDESFSSVTVTGTGEFIGGFAGYLNGGLITNSYAIGNVIGGTENTGGFVGEVDGGAAVTYSYATGAVSTNSIEGIDIGGFAGDIDNSTVAFSYATGDVSGVSYVGGFVGDSDTNAVILYSYATGRVEGTEDKIGGFIGDAVDGVTITDSYTLSLVEGVDEVGGFVGNIENSTLEHVYSAGSSVTGETRVGGLVGDDDGGNTFTMTFFDTETSGLENACGEGDCTNVVGETTENMKDIDTFNPYSEEEYGFLLEDPATYRYIKWEITKIRNGADTDCSTGDVCTQASEFLPTIHGFSALTLIADVTATNPGGVNISGLVAGYLLDDDTSTKFIDGAFSTSNNSNGSSVVIFDAGDGNQVDFNGYNWATGDDMITRDPVSWTVSGSNDGISYTLLDAQTDYSPTTDRQSWIGELNENWDFYQIWGIDGDGVNNVGYPFLQFQDFDYEYSAPVDSETEAPILSAPVTSSTHLPTDEMDITFILPDTLFTGSLTLTFTPEEGDPIILVLDDAAPDVENTFSITPSGGISLVGEVASTTSDSIPGGIYTVTISYQDVSGNPAAADSVSDVEIQELYVISEVTQISGNITNTSPIYHFAIEDGVGEAELLVSEGCGEPLAEAIGADPDDQGIQFTELEVGETYECTIFVRSDSGDSNTLTVGPFTIIASSSPGVVVLPEVLQQMNRINQQGQTPQPTTEQPKQQTYQFTRSLKQGMTGEDVKELQKFLNAQGFTIASSGPGSKGNESTYFGVKTKAALIKYQDAHRADILTPLGLTKGSGLFGPSTMKFINKVLKGE